MTPLIPFASEKSIRLVDAPSDFSLPLALLEAKRIWLVTAFAHMSGWKMIRPALLKSKAKIVFMTGTDFCQSEPVVMREWINKSFQAKAAKAFLFSRPGSTFHPKVFVVEGTKSKFALVGSGNMSAGGLHNNIECFSYISKPQAVSDLRGWIDDLIADKECCALLEPEALKRYEKKFKKAAKLKKALLKITRSVDDELKQYRRPAAKEWSQAIKEALLFF